MFPSFDKLLESEFDQNVALLTADGVPFPASAIQSLMRLAAASAHSDPGASHSPEWYQTLQRVLKEAPAPDSVIAAVDQFVLKSRPARAAFDLFEQTPRSLDVLSRLACGSPFLTQILLNQPTALSDLTTERRTAEMKSRDEFLEEALDATAACVRAVDKLTELRNYQRREILRIGMCDAFGLLDLKFVTLQISLLADAMVQICLRIVCDEAGVRQPPFSVLALGKHGGEELNYSSDIDLILVAQVASTTTQKIARRLIDALSDNLSTGFLYRVDLRLRPWGEAGPLVSTPKTYTDYLASDAELWEKQALLKARVIAGDIRPGEQLLLRLPDVLYSSSSQEIFDSIRRMKGEIEDRLRAVGKLTSEVKLGAGSIRDVEFLVQALQLTHGHNEPRVASPNTLDALVRLAEFGILDASEYRQLREGYIFLRTIEHALQLLHNQQTHELPTDAAQLRWLARRLDYPGEHELLLRFEEHRRAVRAIFDRYFSLQQTPVESAPAVVDSTWNIATNAETSGRAAVASIGTAVSATSWRSFLDRYFEQSADHHAVLRQQLLSGINAGDVCHVAWEPVAGSPQQAVLTILSVDIPELLSMICGLFFGQQLDIREGCTMTGAGTNRFGHRILPGRFLGLFLVESADRSQEVPLTAGAVNELEKSLARFITRYRSGGGDQVRRDLVQIFCDRMVLLPESASPQADLTIFVSGNSPQGKTQLEISADDTWGFFFELSSALALCGFRIASTELGAANGRIQDVLQVTEANGKAIRDHRRIEELQTAVTLIKQFTHWLPSNNDPLNALLRFRDLLQKLLSQSQWESNVAPLRQPRVLRAVSRVLGLSRFLWQDFLRVRSRDLLALLIDEHVLERRMSKTELQAELDMLLAAEEEGRRVYRLNRFKDRHLFRIDLRHVLGHCGFFGSFSEEITELAEVTVLSAGEMAWQQLCRQHGCPRLPDHSVCRYTLVALGKFGGIEMGFASDIEMFLVFEADGHTDGAVPVSTSVFFERLIMQMTGAIEARHKGIFEIDLRMRPYGQAGSAAVSLETFAGYFGIDGDAWPYERQSLVKLRSVGPNAAFGQEVVSLRDQLVYVGQGFDFDALRAMREKQIRQLVHGGTINAKLSSGGLVDCEYAVQALQLTFADQYPALRTPNTLAALTAASEAGLISQTEFLAARQAYVFLRKVIDCLRMVRGNAQDLTVPQADSPDFEQLSRRLRTVHDEELSLNDLDEQMKNVCEFARRVEQICQRISQET
ncbi:MAG: glutamine synthetase adenylyltransferase [Planctomycetaceae bacterium]